VLKTAMVLEKDTDSLPIAIEAIQSLLNKGGEQSRALEPATGPVSNGQSSPPVSGMRGVIRMFRGHPFETQGLTQRRRGAKCWWVQVSASPRHRGSLSCS